MFFAVSLFAGLASFDAMTFSPSPTNSHPLVFNEVQLPQVNLIKFRFLITTFLPPAATWITTDDGTEDDDEEHAEGRESKHN